MLVVGDKENWRVSTWTDEARFPSCISPPDVKAFQGMNLASSVHVDTRQFSLSTPRPNI